MLVLNAYLPTCSHLRFHRLNNTYQICIRTTVRFRCYIPKIGVDVVKSRGRDSGAQEVKSPPSPLLQIFANHVSRSLNTFQKIYNLDPLPHHVLTSPCSFCSTSHITTMILRSILAGLSLLALSHAHNIQLRSHSRECFHETLHKDDKMTVTFQVGDREFGGSGNLDVDFWVRTTLNLSQCVARTTKAMRQEIRRHTLDHEDAPC